jgi:hypothetical protein
MPVGTVELVSQSEYARRRGCTEGAVRRAVRDGRIALIDGKLDPVAADAQWARNTRPRAGSEPAAAPLTAAPDRDGEDDGNGYWASKARRESAEADLAELKLAEQRGQLVRADEVRAAHAKRLAGLREALLQIPARLAAVMAAENSQAACHDKLQAEIHGVLASVSAHSQATSEKG